MFKIGQFNFLQITQKTSKGAFFQAGELGMVFLPANQTPEYCEVGDKVQVFLYRDSRNDIRGTTKRPRIEVGGVACLKVISTSTVGAFLDWGLPKDLFVPFGEQMKPMAVDESHIVRAYEDNTGRICASSKLNKSIKPETYGLKTGMQVNCIVGDKSDLGYKIIVNQKFWGVLHNSDVFRELKYGQSVKGFIKNLRADTRIDITLSEPKAGFGTEAGEVQASSLTSKILAKVKAGDGFMPINDKSSPEIIYREFSVSKKVFKAALGNLYKKRQITIEKDGVRLL
jgi:uncharacterized protein